MRPKWKRIKDSMLSNFHRRTRENSDDIDGGVVKRYWADMPKIIESTEIVRFHCTISLFAVYDTGWLGNRLYELDAFPEDGKVTVKYHWYERNGGSDRAEYIADADSWGIIDEARWDSFYNWLSNESLIEKPIPSGFGFSNEYLS